MFFIGTSSFGQTTESDALKDAHELYDLGEYESVISLLGSIEMVTDKGQFEMLLGDAEHKMEYFDMAIDHYNKAENDGLKTMDLYFHRGAAFISISKYKKAVKDLSKAIELQPEKAELFFYRGYAYTELDKSESAIADFSQAITLKPDYAEAYYNRGAIRIDLQLYDEGLDDLEESQHLGGDKLNISFNKAIITFEKGNYEDAINLFNDLTETDDVDQKRDAYYYLGECYYRLKEDESACRYFYKAMGLGDLDSEEIYHNYCEKGQIRKLFKTRKKTEKVTF
jgi:tetratricopeptide (TPR) repeat protein